MDPSYDDLMKIVGSVYVDAVISVKALTEENRQLKIRIESLEREKQQWNNGKGNCTLPKSLQEKIES